MFDRILVSVGRTPERGGLGPEAAGVSSTSAGSSRSTASMRTNVPGIFAIGDVIGQPMLAHKATHEGKVAAEVIAGVPGAQFDAARDPVGRLHRPGGRVGGPDRDGGEEPRASSTTKAVFPWAASRTRAGARTDPRASRSCSFDPVAQRLLGAGIVGVGAGDLIAETVLGLEFGADAEDIGLTVHPHPTLSETVAFAAEMAAGTITDLMPPRKRR